MKNRLHWIRAFVPVLLIFATVVVYGQFLNNPIVFDDANLFDAGSATELAASGFHPFSIRWLPYVTITWTKELFGPELKYIRIVSLLLHASVGIALYCFLFRIYSLVLQDKQESCFPHRWIAFFAALIFVLNPVAVYGAGYLAQRTIVMATLFSLLALSAYMRGLTIGSQKWLWASTALYFLAVLSKEHSVMLPAVIIALTVLLAEHKKMAFKDLLGVFAAFFSIAVFTVLQKAGIVGAVYEISAPDMLGQISVAAPYPLSILTQSWMFFKYLGLWILPNPAWMSVDMRVSFATTIFSYYLFTALAFVAYGLISVWLLFQRGRKGILGFALLFPWLLFWTEFAAVRIQEPFVLYRSYLWMPGVFVALPLIIDRIKFRHALLLLMSVTLVFSIFSMNRLSTFSHSYLLWNDAEWLVHDKLDLPGVDRIYYNRGKYLEEAKHYREAAEDFSLAIKIHPSNPYYHFGLAGAYYGSEQYDAAIQEFTKSIALDPKSARAYYWRGVCYKRSGLIDQSKNDFLISCNMGWQEGCVSLERLP